MEKIFKVGNNGRDDRQPSYQGNEAIAEGDARALDGTITKSRWERSWPTIACGAGLFSDGYVQSVSLFLYGRISALMCPGHRLSKHPPHSHLWC